MAIHSPSAARTAAQGAAETVLRKSIGQALMDRGAYEWSSSAECGLIFTADFELPGGIPARFESRPSRLWGDVEVTVVIYPRDYRRPLQRPCTVLSLGTRAGFYQGEATAFVCITYNQILPPNVSLFYVSPKLKRELRNVCGY